MLGSTKGTSLQPIIDAINQKTLPGVAIKIIISNKRDAGIIERARRHKIEYAVIESKGKEREAFGHEVSSLLRGKEIGLILLIGYMRILSDGFIADWKGKMLNVHPSLLPKFAGGMDMQVHAEVLDAGEKESGCTVHFVTEEVDGGPIVVQKKCAISEDETPETLKQKVQALEGEAFIEAIGLFRDGKIGRT